MDLGNDLDPSGPYNIDGAAASAVVLLPLPHHVLRSDGDALGNPTAQHVTGERGLFCPPCSTAHPRPHCVAE